MKRGDTIKLKEDNKNVHKEYKHLLGKTFFIEDVLVIDSVSKHPVCLSLLQNGEALVFKKEDALHCRMLLIERIK